MVTIGVDLSGLHCGYARLSASGELTAHGTVSPPASEPYWVRQDAIIRVLEGVMDAGDKADCVVFERIRLFHQGKISLAAIEDLARLSGAVGLTAFRRGIPIETVHTSHYRKRVLGDGKATKKDVVKWVKARFGIEAQTEDEAEAIAMAVYGWLVMGDGKGGDPASEGQVDRPNSKRPNRRRGSARRAARSNSHTKRVPRGRRLPRMGRVRRGTTKKRVRGG